MKTVRILTATHVHALPGTISVTDAECARLCALGVAVPVENEPVQEEEPAKVKTRKKAGK